MKVIKDISYSAYDACKLDVYLPENVQKPPVYVYVHGGGIEGGHKADAPELLNSLAESGVAVVSMDYRMYPTARFPEYLYDVAAGVKWVMDHAEEYDFGTVVMGGSSAGAYICMMLYFNPEYYKTAGVDASRIRGYFFDAGQPTTHFNYLKYEKKKDSRSVVIDEAAPLYYLTEEYVCPENEPYVMIICSEKDIVNRVEQLHVLRTAMLQFGFLKEKLELKYYLGEVHCGYMAKDFYIQDTFEFINKVVENI